MRLLPGILVALTLLAPPAPADPARTLPAGDVLRLLEEGAHAEAAGKAAIERAGRGPGGVVAAELPHSWDALHYRLDVTPSRTSRHVEGTVTVTLVVRDPGLTHVDLDAVGMTFPSIKVAGVPRTTWSAAGGRLLVPVCEGAHCPPHAPGDTLVVEVAYSCNPVSGYWQYPRNAYTFAEPYDARAWWPCWDQPSDKATLDVHATVPESDSCYSNGVLVGTTPAAPGFRTWHWRETHPIATYLVSLAIAPYWRMDQAAAGVPITSVVFPEDSTKAKLEFANVPAMMTAFSGLWGPYPFDKYGQAAVEPFNVGGMEHQTMTTLWRSLVRGDRLFEYVWAHELAHQWWGDWVTCVDFRDIWLNEGFATHGEARWAEAHGGAAAYDSAVAQHMAAALVDDANFRHALHDPPPGSTFSQTVYKKGGSVLHMLRRVLGDAAFDAGLRLYGERHAYANATTTDLQAALEDAASQDLDWFFDPWVFAAGIPSYSWTWQVSPAGAGESDLDLAVRQVQEDAPLYRMPLEFRVSRPARADTFVTAWNDAVPQQSWTVRVNCGVTGVVFDPRKNILKRVEPGTLTAEGGLAAAARGRISLVAAPNPLRATVILRARWDGDPDVSAPEHARFVVFDVAGRVVRDLGAVPGHAGVGADSFAVAWDGRDDGGTRVPAGAYFAQVTIGAKRQARALVVL
jgi:aminopeptidase N